MANDQPEFDVSNLDALGKIKAEQQGLRDLAARAAEHRDKVTEVYTRVVRDYEARIGGLEDRARELRERVREDFQRLDAAWSATKQDLDQARFELQESEFRKEIGEYGPEEFQKRQKMVDATVAEKQRDLDRIGLLRVRFLELLPAEPAAPPSAPPVVPLPAPKPIGPPSSAGMPLPAVPVKAAVPAPLPVPPSPAGPPSSSGLGETMVLPPPGTGDFRVPALVGDESATQILNGPPAAAQESGAFATVAVPPGVLVEEPVAGAPVTHRLGMVTTIGRTPDNQIVIPSREVSRKHAEVVLGQSGYTLRDLGSPNGTFVNGKKVAEHTLREGDRITLAGVTLLFKGKK